MAEVILLMGPPGAGKGTQATFVCEYLSIPHISLGDIFRAEVAEESELGTKIKDVMDSGAYVSDEIAIDAIRKRLSTTDCDSGYLMDGFPRTVAQAQAFELILTERDDNLQVIQLDVPKERLISRIIERASESGRSDDTEEIFKKRLEVYFKQTAPLSEYYSEQGILKPVDGVGEISEVSSRIKDILKIADITAVNLQ